MDALRQAPLVVLDELVHLGHDLQSALIAGAEHLQLDGRLAVEARELIRLGEPVHHTRHITQPQPRAVPART